MSGTSLWLTAALTVAALTPGLFIPTFIALSPESELDEEVAEDSSEDMMLNYRKRSTNNHNQLAVVG